MNFFVTQMNNAEQKAKEMKIEVKKELVNNPGSSFFINGIQSNIDELKRRDLLNNEINK